MTKLALSFLGLVLAMLAVLAVFLNNGVAVLESTSLYLIPVTFFYVLLAFFLGLIPGSLGLAIFVFLIPLSPNLHGQINAIFGANIQAQSNPGIDLAAGFFAGVVCREFFLLMTRKQKSTQDGTLQFSDSILPPWPVALAILVMTLSATLAIWRNAWQSAAPISIKGVIFNLSHFRPMGWHDDFIPMTEWVAFSLALAALIAVMIKLKELPSLRDQYASVFVPLMLGVIFAGLVGIIQARTGLGLPEASLEFRRDRIGYAAQGFQPDIHSYAAHMLIGVVGLWGYWYAFIRRGAAYFEPSAHQFILMASMGLAWVGLIVSKSRFSFLIATLTIIIGATIYLWKNHRRWLYPLGAAFFLMLIGFVITLFAYRNQSSFWMIHLIAQLQERGFSSITAVGGIFGDRPEIFSAALRMFQSFPLMGLGLGDFFRMSSNATFSQSALLSVRGGENAHNYFLQTLTETGLVGALSLIFALIAPLLFAQKRTTLMPAAIALFAILLGNVYAHSLLVRENLILAAVMLALMYFIYAKQVVHFGNAALHSAQTFYGKAVLGCFVLLLVFGSAREVYRSFNVFPFQYGSICYVPKALTADGWTSGKTMGIPLPVGARGVRLPVDITRPGISAHPLDANLQIMGFRWSVLASANARWTENGRNVIEVTLPNNQVSDGSIDAVLSLSTCYTPRNQGISVDGRRLGVLLGPPEFF